MNTIRGTVQCSCAPLSPNMANKTDESLNTFQLSHALSQSEMTRDKFEGVYPVDHLKHIQDAPKMIIVNTDPSYKPGKHWLLFYSDRNTIEMFDSLGRDITEYPHEITDFVNKFSHVLKYVNDRLQPVNSSLCGHYCLYYAYHRCNGDTMQNIIHDMHSPDWIRCCVPIMFDIPNVVSDCQICQTV